MEQILIGKKAKPSKSVGTDRTAKTIRNKRKKSDAVVYADKLAKTTKTIEKQMKIRVWVDRDGKPYPVITHIHIWHKNIKLYSAISGNPDHNRLMKNHINRLIKEVDHCIAELQNSGL